MTFVRLAIIIAGLLLASAATAADNDSGSVAGEWKGEIVSTRKPVFLTITNARTGQAAGKIKFGAPDNCTMSLQFVSLKDGSYNFTARGTEGNACVGLSGGNLTFKTAGNFSLTKGQVRVETKLSRAP